MAIENKQSYAAFCQDDARKYPDYTVVALAGMWAVDILNDRKAAGSPPGTIESRKINQECINRIYAAVESGELEATYPEQDIQTAWLDSKTDKIIRDEYKVPALWIVETSKYIEWARANGVGPKILVEDVIETVDAHSESSYKAAKKQSTLERETMLALILGMAIDAYGYDPEAKRNTSTGDKKESIAGRLPECLKVDSDTIRKYLTEAVSLYPDSKPRKP